MAKKFPYVSCTQKELREMETYSFVIHMGGDFLVHDGYNTFTEKEAAKVFENTFNDLMEVIESGSEKDSKYALALLATLKIHPMRMH